VSAARKELMRPDLDIVKDPEHCLVCQKPECPDERVVGTCAHRVSE
jgi:hypothetical protein